MEWFWLGFALILPAYLLAWLLWGERQR